jgi:hypothetical protein
MVMIAFCPSGLLGLVERAMKTAVRQDPPVPALSTEVTGP